MAFDLKSLEKLLVLVKKHKLAELEVEDGKQKIRIKSAMGQVFAAPSATAFAALPSEEASVQKSGGSKSKKEDERYAKVLSPFVGTFYSSPSPEAEAYVKVGQMVKKGDVLCIIEAMKLMNEIECEISGKIVSTVAENGQPVEYGEPLFLIDPV